MSRCSTWGIFYREEEIAGLIVLGSCPWSPEGFVNHVNSGADEGLRASFRQAAVRAPLIIWSGPDWGGGGLHQTGLGSGPVLSNRIIKTAAYLWAKNRFTAVVHFVLGRLHIWFYYRSKQHVFMSCLFLDLLVFLLILGLNWTNLWFTPRQRLDAKMKR